MNHDSSEDYSPILNSEEARVGGRNALLLTLQGRSDLTSSQIRTQGGKNIVEIQKQTF